jgi:AcrR family transcriptional regulator
MPASRSVLADVRSGSYHHGDLKRSLVDAALALVSEEQTWGFSLREVARRAGVSHNAPYRHFPEKRDLLAAVAAAGYEALRARMLAAASDTDTAEAALVAIGVAYVRFGTEDPARYRLTFGSALAKSGEGLPAPVAETAAQAKAVLGDVILRGAREGRFAASPDNQAELDLLVLSAWSIVHGLTMLVIDRLAGRDVPIAEHVARTLLDGIRRR